MGYVIIEPKSVVKQGRRQDLGMGGCGGQGQEGRGGGMGRKGVKMASGHLMTLF